MSRKILESEPLSRKRPRHEEAEPTSENDVEKSRSLSLEENFTFSDTLMALRMMRAQFPHLQKVSVPPFVLQSQLYSSIKDRTEVAREIESLKRERVLRIFKLNSGQGDHAIMFTDDYINQIEGVVRRMEDKNKKDLVIFEWFKTHVLQSKLDSSISHQELWSLLSLGGKVKEEHISLLISAGLLRNVEVTEIAASALLQSDPQDSSAYVLLSNIYADAEMWGEVSKIRRIMRSNRLKKEPGCSWIEVQAEVHMFLVRDKAHPRCDEIYESMDLLMAEMKPDARAPLYELLTNNGTLVVVDGDQELCAISSS